MLLVTAESKVKVSLLFLLPVRVTASTFTPTLLLWKLAKIPSMKKTLCCWFMLLMMSCDVMWCHMMTHVMTLAILGSSFSSFSLVMFLCWPAQSWQQSVALHFFQWSHFSSMSHPSCCPRFKPAASLLASLFFCSGQHRFLLRLRCERMMAAFATQLI